MMTGCRQLHLANLSSRMQTIFKLQPQFAPTFRACLLFRPTEQANQSLDNSFSNCTQLAEMHVCESNVCHGAFMQYTRCHGAGACQSAPCTPVGACQRALRIAPPAGPYQLLVHRRMRPRFGGNQRHQFWERAADKVTKSSLKAEPKWWLASPLHSWWETNEMSTTFVALLRWPTP